MNDRTHPLDTLFLRLTPLFEEQAPEAADKSTARLTLDGLVDVRNVPPPAPARITVTKHAWLYRVGEAQWEGTHDGTAVDLDRSIRESGAPLNVEVIRP